MKNIIDAKIKAVREEIQEAFDREWAEAVQVGQTVRLFWQKLPEDANMEKAEMAERAIRTQLSHAFLTGEVSALTVAAAEMAHDLRGWAAKFATS